MTVFLSLMLGAGIGVGVSLLVYVLGFVVEMFNCACNCFSCNSEYADVLPFLWEEGRFISIFIFCVIAGAIIGLIVGLFKYKIDYDEKAKKQREAEETQDYNQRRKTAVTVKNYASQTASFCQENLEYKKPAIIPIYEADTQMTRILGELASASALQGKLDAIAEDMDKKGGQ